MRRGSQVACAAVVVVAGFVVPLVVARHYHALGVPRGDDWSYLRTLFHWTVSGKLNFNHWVSMTLVGQLVLAAPIALVHSGDTSSVQTLTALIGVLGLYATLAVGRRCGLALGRATFVAVLASAAPYFGVLTVSFMTDVPAFGWSALSLAVGCAALSRRPISVPLILTSLGLGLYAFTIRQYAAIPAAAVAITAAYALLLERDRERLRTVAIAAAVAAAGAVAFYAYWRTIPDPKPFPLGFPTSHAISTVNYKGAGMLRLVGFWLLPALLLADPFAIVRRAWRASRTFTVVLVAGLAGWLVFTGAKEPRNAFSGNYFIPEGALGRGVGTGVRPRIVPLRLFELFVAAGTIGAIVVVLAVVPAFVALGRAVRTRALPRPPATQLPVIAVAVAVAGYALAYAVAALAGLPLYDRYTLPIAPLVAILLVRPRPATLTTTDTLTSADGGTPAVARARSASWPAAAAGVMLVALFALGLDYTADSASYDGARWRVAEAARNAGWRPVQIGGNFEWVNFYAISPGTAQTQVRHVCVVVSVGTRARQRAGKSPIALGTYSPPFHDDQPVVAYRTRLPCVRGVTPSPGAGDADGAGG